MVDPQVLAHLTSKGVPCAAIGALALATHGAARYSSDTDLLVMDPAVLRESFWADSGLASPEIRIGDSSDPLAGLVRFHGIAPLDVVVGKSRAARFALESAMDSPILPCKVITPVGLTLLKIEAGGPKDLQDLSMLRSAQKALTGWVMNTSIEPHLQLLKRSDKETWNKFLTLFSEDPAKSQDPFQGGHPETKDDDDDEDLGPDRKL